MRNYLLCFVAIFIVTHLLFAQDKGGSSGQGLNKSSKVTVNWAKHERQGYTMKVWLSNQMAMGIEAWDGSPPADACASRGLGLEYPAGSCVEHLYGAGPWIGGVINGSRFADEGYNGDNALKEFLPERWDTARDRFYRASTNEPLLDLNFNPPHALARTVGMRQFDDDGDGKVDEDELDGLDNDGDWVAATDDVGADGIQDTAETGCKGPYVVTTNPDPAFDNLAPSKYDRCHTDANGNFPQMKNRDKYTERNGIPDHGEPHVDEDYAAISENDLYCQATDTFRSTSVGGHRPMGIKVLMKSFAWSGSFAEGVLPIDYYFINIGQNRIDSVFVGFFADMDVGPVGTNYAGNNFAGYFESLRTAYIHNALQAGSTPLGLTVLGTPRDLSSLRYVFQWHGFNEPGTDDEIIYSWMSCERFGYQDCIKANQPPSSPTDTRFFFSFGPFDVLKPGDTLKISVALVGGEGLEDGPNNLKENAQKALKLFKRGFHPPLAPPAPKAEHPVFLHVSQISEGVKLEWNGTEARELWDDSNKVAEQDFPPDHWRRRDPPIIAIDSTKTPPDTIRHTRGGRIFEGYRFYRSEDPDTGEPSATSFTLVRQWDVEDDQFEYNVGLDTEYTDKNLVRGKNYWYAVTSFGIPDRAVIEIPGGDSGSTRYQVLDIPGGESPVDTKQRTNLVRVNIPFTVSERKGEVLVVPNPYRGDVDYTYENGGWEGRASKWNETRRRVKFIHLPKKCTIRVFTLAGDLVSTLEHDDPERGELEWDLLSGSKRALASGVYVFSVESDLGSQIGKFVLIR